MLSKSGIPYTVCIFETIWERNREQYRIQCEGNADYDPTKYGKLDDEDLLSCRINSKERSANSRGIFEMNVDSDGIPNR